MGKFIDLSGKKIGKWNIVKRINLNDKKTHWLCICDCGKEKLVNSSHLLGGRSTRCKICHNIEASKKSLIKHGQSNKRITKEYRSWARMKTRCLNKNSEQYKYYGLRGICIDEDWIRNFNKFFEDMGKCPEGMSLDRKDVNGNYCKENCRWATIQQQCENKRNNIKYSYYGCVKTITEWSRIMKVPYTTLKRYIDNNSWILACEKWMPWPQPVKD